MKISEIFRLKIRDVHKLLINGDVSITELQSESLRLIRSNDKLNPFVTTCLQETSQLAIDLDKSISKRLNKNDIHPLCGIPISIKDNFCTDGVLTTCASKMLHNFVPNYTATPVAKLQKANCLIMGKTNMDEFAMGSSSLSSYYGPTANIWGSETLSEKPQRSKGKTQYNQNWFMAGGSSSGGAVSVASGSCFASLGTDTGGSTRHPASMTGIVGFKPTYGLISRFGLIPLAHCLDVVSILARTVDDVRIIFDTIIGKDVNDMTSVDHLQRLKKCKWPKTENVTVRIGIPERFIELGDLSDSIAHNFDNALKRLQDDIYIHRNGTRFKFELIKLELDHSRLSTECYTVISSAEIASNMSCYDGLKYGYSSEIDPKKKFKRDEFFKKNRDDGFGDEVKKRILLGNYFMLSENRQKYFDQATRLRRCIQDEFQEAFLNKKIDIIMTPSTPTTSIPYHEWLKKQSDNKLFYEDYFLIPSNMANLPSLSLPVFNTSQSNTKKFEAPLGVQLIANQYEDENLLFVSDLLQDCVFKTL